MSKLYPQRCWLFLVAICVPKSWWSSGVVLTLLFTLFGTPTGLYAGGGNALLLDGTNDKAQATGTVYPNSTTLQSFTVEAWIRPDRAGSVIATDDAFDLILFNQPGAANGGVGIKFAIFGANSTSHSKTEFRGVRLGECAHVAAMFDAVTKKYWIAINGVLSASPTDFPSTGLGTDPSYAFTVGSFGSSGFFDGLIDEVRVSSVARYQANFVPPQVLTVDADTRGLWRFDEPVGTTVFSDASGGATTLTGSGGAATAVSPCSSPSKTDAVISFGSGLGLWHWMNNSTWQQLHPAAAAQLATGDLDGNGIDDVIISFGPELGLWRWMNNSTWQQLHTASAARLVTGNLGP